MLLTPLNLVKTGLSKAKTPDNDFFLYKTKIILIIYLQRKIKKKRNLNFKKRKKKK